MVFWKKIIFVSLTVLCLCFLIWETYKIRVAIKNDIGYFKSGANVPAVFEPSIVNLGKLFQNQTITYSVNLKNKGTNDLRITAMHTTCSCTIVNTNIIGQIIKPKKSIPLTFTFDTGRRDEMFNGFITVRTEDSSKAYISQVKLQGEVLSDFSIKPQYLDFGELKSGSIITQNISIVPRGVTNFKIISLESSRQEFAPNIVDGKDGTPSGIKVCFNAPDTTFRKIITGTLKVRTTCPRLKELLITMQCTVVPDIELIPDTLYIRNNSVDSKDECNHLVIRTYNPSILEKVAVESKNSKTEIPIQVNDNSNLDNEHRVEIPVQQIKNAERICIKLAIQTQPDRKESKQAVIKVISLN